MIKNINTIQYNTIQYNTIQYNTIQYKCFIAVKHTKYFLPDIKITSVPVEKVHYLQEATE